MTTNVGRRLCATAVVLWAGTTFAATSAIRCEAAKVSAAGREALCFANEQAKELMTGRVPHYARCSTRFSAFTDAVTPCGRPAPG